MTKTSHELRAHILSLTKAFNVELEESDDMVVLNNSFMKTVVPVVKNGRGTAVDMTRRIDKIIVRPIINEETYAVALHELGHSQHPSGLVRVPGKNEHNHALKIVEEESAWEWAQKHALCWTPEMEEAKRYGLSSYYVEQEPLHVWQKERLQKLVTPALPRKPSESIDDFLKRRK